MDAGPMLGVVRTPIGPVETTGELEERLSRLAVPLLFQVIDQIEAGTVSSVLQDPALVTRVRKLSKVDGRIDWNRPAVQVERHVRGMQPWPGPFSEFHQPGRHAIRMQILSVQVKPIGESTTARPGDILTDDPHQIVVRCGQDAVQIDKLQPDGKRPMAAAEFLRGHAISLGDRFE